MLWPARAAVVGYGPAPALAVERALAAGGGPPRLFRRAARPLLPCFFGAGSFGPRARLRFCRGEGVSEVATSLPEVRCSP